MPRALGSEKVGNFVKKVEPVPMTKDPSKPTNPRFDAMIDENLKRAYSDLVQEELPDRFKELLAQLKQQDSERSPGK